MNRNVLFRTQSQAKETLRGKMFSASSACARRCWTVKIAFGFFQSRLWRDQTERGAFAITGNNLIYKILKPRQLDL